MPSQQSRQLTKHIMEALAMEQSVLRMLDSMLRTTEDPDLGRALEEHQRATRRHADRLKERLRAYGARPSLARQAGGVVLVGAKSVVDAARRQKPARNARDGFATEQMEVAAYELLERVAREAGDEETAEVARRNRAEDQAMADVIAGSWDKIAQATVSADGERGGGLAERAKSARGLLSNPVAIVAGSVVGGLLFGRRMYSEQRQTEGDKALQALTKAELQSRASQSGIEVKRSMTKQDLVQALEHQASSSAARQKANPVEVQKFLEGVGYPATRTELVREAERQGATERVRTTLAKLPARKRFKSPTEVSEVIAKA